MSKTWTKISQANVDHYNNHKAEHVAITAAYAVFAVVAIRVLVRRLTKSNRELAN